ncbi:hypothetical protein K1T71_010400 [Dendrolimus kikuchii]|uniref:Uncharacterized protein n=1 Tax=Dendrolimus kikuchii TaxID=765133 RepID=A0ACC1CRE5_9NEOP|nr:hypothetical protein K1T71_010400 [Dendrolimus kikuchii]
MKPAVLFTFVSLCLISISNSVVSLSTLELKHLMKKIIPSLEGTVKGDLGKIGVLGGSIEYTGAPYFTAISAFKVGADLVYVVTTDNTAQVIKVYSPDLIVYPYFNKSHGFKINSLLPKMDVVVIGPGLGREEETLQLIYNIIEDCKKLQKPLVIDADGLYAVTKNVSILKDYSSPGVILTPNLREAKYLMASTTNDSNWYKYWGDHVSVLIKGREDKYYSIVENVNWGSSEGGSNRRAGGQGDILSGALGTFYKWAIMANLNDKENPVHLAKSIAAFAAAQFTRECNAKAFEKHGRSMLSSDMIQEMHSAFDQIFL